MHRLDNGILREKPGRQRETDQRQRADQRGKPRYRHITVQPPHLAYVLLMMQRDYHGTRGEEQQGP